MHKNGCYACFSLWRLLSSNQITVYPLDTRQYLPVTSIKHMEDGEKILLELLMLSYKYLPIEKCCKWYYILFLKHIAGWPSCSNWQNTQSMAINRNTDPALKMLKRIPSIESRSQKLLLQSGWRKFNTLQIFIELTNQCMSHISHPFNNNYFLQSKYITNIL